MHDPNRYVPAEELGKRITTLRNELGISKAGLARIIDVSDVTISYWEAGRVDAMSWRKLVALADTLNVSFSELVEA